LKLKVHFTLGDGKGWALDEDLRQIRIALRERIRETSAGGAQIIHAPFWQNLAMVEPGILRRAFIIAHADNPPFFYVKQPEFALGQTWVDLWVARSTEALEQFQQLGLSAVHIPYTIDARLFFPIGDKKALRREFGIPEEAYVIANFHRDTEGVDLKTPKFQKAPEMMVAILKHVRDAGVRFHVLLAGPRRHWIRKELTREQIPFTFVGKGGIDGDDFGKNILSREKLNRLYNAADLHLVPSRWEGGPQSVMEAAACRIKQLSPPIGVARDILEPESLFRSAEGAARKISEDARGGLLDDTIENQFQRWNASHTTATLESELRKLYERLPQQEGFQSKVGIVRPNTFFSSIDQIRYTMRRRLKASQTPAFIRWNHLGGRDEDLDEVMEWTRKNLEGLGIVFTNSADAELEVCGWPLHQGHSSCRRLQFVTNRLPIDKILLGATLVVPAVQDLLNIRQRDVWNPAVVLPIPFRQMASGSGWFVVAENDISASIPIWRSMSAGRPVLYPERSAYFEQVYWGGMPWQGEPHLPQPPIEEDCLGCLHFPLEKTAAANLRKLLCL
jgi:glycosyltransferase involved in cell wall biosynthesis